MGRFIAKRLLLIIPTVIAISIISFVIIQAPPGDFLSFYVARLMEEGEVLTHEQEMALRDRYGLDKPLVAQYFGWISGIVQGDFGRSLQWQKPVGEIIAARLPASFAISFISLLFVYLVSIPIGVYSATHQYSVGDYLFTTIGFIGLAIPNFFFALILLYSIFKLTGNVQLGLFSLEYQTAPWSLGKLIDLIKHIWIPAVVIGTAGTCGRIRIMRANMLDELQKPYYMVAKSKGLPPMRILFKYPFRIAINPLVSRVGWILATLVSGELLVSLVLNIPTLSPVFLGALKSQDMFLAGSIVLILSSLTVIGTLLSDILLAWVDPRIRQSV